MHGEYQACMGELLHVESDHVVLEQLHVALHRVGHRVRDVGEEVLQRGEELVLLRLRTEWVGGWVGE